MADNQTTNLGYYIPAHGTDVNTWDEPLNANSSALDDMAANLAIISLSNAPVTLSVPPNSGASWSGPYQSQSAVIRFTGILTANVTVTLPRAGFWIIENLTTGAFVVFLASAAPGKVICAPPGEMTHVFCDGTDVKYVDFGRIGSYLFLGASAIPAWISNCTVIPFLNCDGTTFNATTYPVLNSYLGGNTLPDLRGRMFASLNQGTGRLNAGGVDADTILAAGGADTQTITQSVLPAYNLPVTDPKHSHTFTGGGVVGASGGSLIALSTSTGTTSLSATGITVNLGGGGNPLPTTPPIAVGGLIMIRAG